MISRKELLGVLQSFLPANCATDEGGNGTNAFSIKCTDKCEKVRELVKRILDKEEEIES